MTTQLSTIQFHNQSLVTFEKDGIFYTAMKPICENIGLAWHSQYERIKRDEVLNQGILIIRTPTNGGDQQMLCLPIDYLNGWLFGIDVKRVKPEIRDTLIMYKKECYKALADYWFKGKAERSQNPQPNLPLADETLALLVKSYHFLYEAHDLRNKAFRTVIGVDIDRHFGEYYLHNLGLPLKQHLEKIQAHIHESSERIVFVKGMLSLLEEPKQKRIADF